MLCCVGCWVLDVGICFFSYDIDVYRLRTRLFMFEHVCMYTKYTCIHASAFVLWDVACLGSVKFFPSVSFFGVVVQQRET